MRAVSLFLNITRGILLATHYYKKKSQSDNNRLEFLNPEDIYDWDSWVKKRHTQTTVYNF